MSDKRLDRHDNCVSTIISLEAQLERICQERDAWKSIAGIYQAIGAAEVRQYDSYAEAVRSEMKRRATTPEPGDERVAKLGEWRWLKVPRKVRPSGLEKKTAVRQLVTEATPTPEPGE